MIQISREYVCGKYGTIQERTKMVSKSANIRYSELVFEDYLQVQGMTFDGDVLTCHEGVKCELCNVDKEAEVKENE